MIDSLMVDSLLTSAQRHAMLEDIARIGLTLGRSLQTATAAPVPVSAAATFAATHNGADTATPLERLHLLERLWPRMEAALVALAQAPRSLLIGQSLPIPLRQARGGPQAAHAMARNPACAAAWNRALTSDRTNSGGATDFEPRDPAVPERRFQTSTATPVNRFAGTVVAELEREARRLTALAEFCQETDCAARCHRLELAAGRWRMRPPFAGLPLLTARERLQMRQVPGAMQGDAPFRALHACWRTLRHPLHFDWSDSPLLFLPALETWHLYEIWCFLTAARCLQQLGWLPVGPSAQRQPPEKHGAAKAADRTPFQSIACGPIHCTPEGLRLRPATGRASQLRFRCPGAVTGRSAVLTLTYQPLFPSANRREQQSATGEPLPSPERGAQQPAILEMEAGNANRESSCASLSHDMQPDIALEWRGRLYLLDAKYRRYATREAVGTQAVERGYQALLEDIDKMHTYRDSIVRGRRRAVSHAWCLWPGSAETAVIAYPSGTADMPFGAAGIGALALRPGAEPEALLRLLQHWFAPRAALSRSQDDL